MWEAVEAETREVRMVETEKGRKKGRSRKETREEGIGEKGKKKPTRERKMQRSWYQKIFISGFRFLARRLVNECLQESFEITLLK